MVGGVWNGFLLGKMRGEAVPCRFCGGADGDGRFFFWDCPYPLVNEIPENLEFHDLMRMDKSQWPRCLLWHGWLLLLSGVNGESPWAVTADDAAVKMLESALGAYTARVLGDWEAPVGVGWDAAADRMPAYPDVLTDVLFVTRLLALHLLGLGSMLACMLILGQTVVWGILMVLVLLRMAWLHLVEASALFLDPCRLVRWLSFGV